MKRELLVLACLCALGGGVYFGASKWAIRHEALEFFDAARARPVAVDIAVRRDYERKANDGFWKLPHFLDGHETAPFLPADPAGPATLEQQGHQDDDEDAHVDGVA